MPVEAKALGCNPRDHFKILADGRDITLPNGSVVKSSQVTEARLPTKAFIIVFLDKNESVESFVNDNQKLFEKIREQQALKENKFNLHMIYHSVPLSIIHNPLYRLEMMAKWQNKDFDPIHVLDVIETNRP
jgi:hypothetical protein